MTTVTQSTVAMNQREIDMVEGETARTCLEDPERAGHELQEKILIYGITSRPPVHITVISALQQALLALSGSLVVSLLVAEAVCARDDNHFKAKLLSSTLFMNGITTMSTNLFGIRLPLFQGASSEYIVPLLLLANGGGTFCSSLKTSRVTGMNVTSNSTVDVEHGNNEALIMSNIQASVVGEDFGIGTLTKNSSLVKIQPLG